MILDTSALVAILRDEAEAPVMAAAIEAAAVVRLSAASYVEAAAALGGLRDPITGRALDEFLREAGIEIEPFTEAQAHLAREAYRDFGKGAGHPARLNLGDCFAYALAKDKREPLLFTGADFSHTDIRPALAR